MLELVRLKSETVVHELPPGATAGNLVMGFARTNEDLEAIQRLRYQVFTSEMNAVFPDAVDGMDIDRFDPWCHHIMVKEANTGKVVGTYRLMTPENSLKAGGFYSESEFDLSALGNLRHECVEAGRSCTHPDYRSGSAIMLLWTGMAQFMWRNGYRYLLGCASVSLRDDGATAAEVWRVAQKSMADHPEVPQLTPLHRYPVEKLTSVLPARVPPLIKGYLNIGASICGQPAWDPDFNTADFPVLMDIQHIDERYRRHFGLV